jgi:hypothetical protein
MNRVIAPWSTVVLIFAMFGFTVSFGARIASAQSIHFIDSKTSLILGADGDLTVQWKEAGLGDNMNIDYKFMATASVTCTCVTKSGKCPSAANKATFTEDTSTQGTFTPKNGSVSASLTLSPTCPTSLQPTCGGGQHFALSGVSYANISFEDQTDMLSPSGLATSAGPVTIFSCP